MTIKSTVEEEEGPEQMQRERRRIVSWSQEEDDKLREQIRIHGTENWASIAAKFKDKTTRQCRRRWHTIYLNSDFKKGGWSPEEDLLLCEAQKIFGNRWTEISKVVPGRTDNAVKNRFTSLCKKMAKKYEERNTSFINLNNKRVICNGSFSTQLIPETDTFSSSSKKKRYEATDELLEQDELCATNQQQLRPSTDELCALEQDARGEAQSTPVYGLQAAEVSSPKFSESERQFLLKAFGMEGLHSNPRMQDSQPPPCKGSSSSMVFGIHTDHTEFTQ